MNSRFASRWTCAMALALAGLTPAAAATRSYTVTSFDRVIVEGPFQVSVTTGRGPSARADGETRGIDGVSITQTGRTVTIRRDRSAWGGYPGEGGGRVSITLTTPALLSASLSGNGALSVDHMKGQSLALALAGAGSLAVEAAQADRISIAVDGPGQLSVAGRAALASFTQQGGSSIAATGLQTEDLTVTATGAGSGSFAARRTARITASGSGSIAVEGNPACTVRSTGSGLVSCGKER